MAVGIHKAAKQLAPGALARVLVGAGNELRERAMAVETELLQLARQRICEAAAFPGREMEGPRLPRVLSGPHAFGKARRGRADELGLGCDQARCRRRDTPVPEEQSE